MKIIKKNSNNKEKLKIINENNKEKLSRTALYQFGQYFKYSCINKFTITQRLYLCQC
jgi:hypothetical protein